MIAFRIFLLICILIPVSVQGANNHSFVVGINSYINLPSHQQLTRSINDAISVSEELNKLGFSGRTEQNLTRFSFNEKWQVFLDKVQEGDTVVLFFSGHGIEIEGKNYILPSDTPYIKFGRQERIKRESLSITDILLDLRGRNPRVTILILDACRDNPMIPPQYKSTGGGNGGLARMEAPEGTFIMYSSSSNGISLDRLPGDQDVSKNSIYTRLLLPLLRKRNLTLPNLARKLRVQVRELASTVGHKQRPAYYDGLDGQFCFGGCDDTLDKQTNSIENTSNIKSLQTKKEPSVTEFANKKATLQLTASSKLIQFILLNSDTYKHGDDLKIKIRPHSSNVSAFAIFEPTPENIRKVHANYSLKEGGVYIKYTLPNNVRTGKHTVKVYIQEIGTRKEEQHVLHFYVK